jgi:GEVED domain
LWIHPVLQTRSPDLNKTTNALMTAIQTRLSVYFAWSKVCALLLLLCIAPSANISAQTCFPSNIEIPNNQFDEDCDGLDDIFLHLPPFIYAVAGQELEVYYRNLILSQHPQDYRFQVSTPVGGSSASLEKWVYTATQAQVGEHPFTITVTSPAGNVLKTATCQLRVCQSGTPPNISPKKLMLWGHSFIDQGYMPYYLDSLLDNGTNPPVSFHGKRGNWVDNNKSRFEAVGGSSWLLYYNTPGSPFFYNGQLNMRAYFDEVCGLGQNPDWIVIHLDVNDCLFVGALDAATLTSVDDYIDLIYNTRAAPLMAAIRAAAPNAKIGITYTPMPNARQSAFTNTFGSGSILANKYRWQKIVSRLLFKNTQYFAGRENENIYLIPAHLDLDDLNDYGTSDPVHPVVSVSDLKVRSGYREIAKSTYSWIKYLENPVGTPPVCSILSATPTQISCNNNGTINDPADDTYSFNLNVAVQNGTGTWQATGGGTNNSGAYNTPKNIGPIPISNGSLNLFVSDAGTASCNRSITVNPPATCSNGINPIICNGNLLLNPGFENGAASWNGVGTLVNDAAEGIQAIKVCGSSYNNHRQTFVGEPSKSYTLRFSAKRDPITSTRNPYAHVKFLTSGFSFIDVKTVEVTTSAYQEYLLSVASPANAAYIEVAFVVDSGTGCITADQVCFSLSTGTPTCNISGQLTNLLCNNNGTASITTDDTYTYNLNVTGSGIGTGWTTTFQGATITGSYGTPKSMGPAPISSGNATLTIRDQANTNCTATVQVVPPATCSNTPACNISGQLTNLLCNNSGTASITTDDTYTYNLNVTGSGTGAGWTAIFQGATITGTYGTPKSMGPAQISSGNATLTIRDQANTNCTATVQVVPPAICSNTPACNISGQLTNLLCNNNGTASITTDDTYTYNLNVTGSGTGAGWTTIFQGATITGSYGTPKSMGPAPISSGNATLTIRDQANTNCTATVQVVPPATCSTPVPTGCANNLVNNGGFETGLTQWDQVGATLVADAVTGAQAVRVCSSGGFNSIRQTIPVTVTGGYELKVMAKRDNTATRNPVLQVKAMSSSWQPLLTKFVEINTQTYSSTIVAITAPVGTAYLEAMIFVDGTTGCVYADDFCLTKTTGGGGNMDYCTSASSKPWEEWINSVRVNADTRTSAKTTYSDFTGTQFNLTRTASNAIELKCTYSYFTYEPFWKAWVDFNKNGTFDEPSEIVLQARGTKPTPGSNAESTQQGNFNVPATASTGTTRMRVAMSRSAFPGPCDTPEFGEIEDFTVNLGTSALQSSQENLGNLIAPPDFTLYPNPAVSQVLVQFDSDALDKSIELRLYSPSANFHHQLRLDRLHAETIAIPLSEIATGVYFVQIRVDGQRPVVRKLVVIRE